MPWPWGDPEKKRGELRTKRENRREDNENTLREIKSRYNKAVEALKKIQDKWSADHAIEELESEKNGYDHQMKHSGGGAGYDDHDQTMEVEPTKQERLYLDDVITLRKLESDAENKSIELTHAKDIVEEAKKKYLAAYAGKTGDSLVETRKEKTAAESALHDLQSEIQMMQFNMETVKDRVKEYEVKNPVQGQNPTVSRKLLMQLKEEAEQKITAARSDRVQLYKDLEDAQKTEMGIRKEKEDFEGIVKQMDQMDNDQHASVMVCVQEGLLAEQFNTLKDNYVINKTVPPYRVRELTSFSGLWILLESKGYILVGDYRNLRKDLQKMSLKSLASDVEKLEDELLKEYETGRTALTQLHDAKYDTHTKLLNKRFETVYPNAKQFDTPGEPCRFYKACLTVVCDYHNNLDDKSESSKGVHKFLKEKLDRKEIIAAAERHASGYYSMKNKLAQTERQLETAKSDILERDKEIKTLKTSHQKDIEKLNKHLKNAGESSKKDKDEYDKLMNDMAKKLKDHEKDSSGLQQQLIEANKEMERLLTEKRNSDEKFREFQKLQAIIIEEYDHEADERISEVESFKDRIRDEEIGAVRQDMNDMREKHKKELEEERQKADKDMKDMEKIFEDYEKALTESRKCAMAVEMKLRKELNGKLLALEKDYGEDMVEWDKEQMELKTQLFEAKMMQEIGSHRTKDMETKIRLLENKLANANERIEILRNGLEEQSD